MHRIVIGSARRRVACLVALVYVAGCIMPSATIAFGNGPASAICIEEITEQVHVAATHVHVHVHSDGTVHHHVDKKPPDAVRGETAKGEGGTGTPSHSHDANCCGLFGFSAVLPQLNDVILDPAAGRIEPPTVANFLVGGGPDRIDRPPILPLPL